MGSIRPMSTIGNRYLFTGREWTPELGVYHFRSRAYDPAHGRFVQREPLAPVMSRYGYGGHDPINIVDAMGMFDVDMAKRIFLETYGDEGQRLLNAFEQQGRIKGPYGGEPEGGRIISEGLWFRTWDLWLVSGTVGHNISIDKDVDEPTAARMIWEILYDHPSAYGFTLDKEARDVQGFHQEFVRTGAELTRTAVEVGYGALAGAGGAIVFVARDIEEENVDIFTLAAAAPLVGRLGRVGRVKILTRAGRVVDEFDSVDEFVAGLCFGGETLVDTESGLRPISKVGIGDRVWGWDAATGERALHEVLQVTEREAPAVVGLTIGGEEIAATAEHPFLLEDAGWIQAGHLQAGDVLITRDGSAARVDSIRSPPGPRTVYNLEVEGAHTYYVSSARVLVHNNPCAQPPGRGGAPRGGEPIRRLGSLRHSTTNVEQVFNNLQRNHGIDRNLASERLHAIKRSAGMRGADNVLFDRTGNVYSPTTREWLGSLTQGGARGR